MLVRVILRAKRIVIGQCAVATFLAAFAARQAGAYTHPIFESGGGINASIEHDQAGYSQQNEDPPKKSHAPSIGVQ